MLLESAVRRVVITGMGVFSSTGKNRDCFFRNLVQGPSGVRPISQFDSSSLSIQIAAEIADYDPFDYFPSKRLDLLDKFRKALRLDPSQVQAHIGLGNTMFQRKDWDGAEAEFREALRLKPDDEDARFGLCMVLNLKGKRDEASALFGPIKNIT